MQGTPQAADADGPVAACTDGLGASSFQESPGAKAASWSTSGLRDDCRAVAWHFGLGVTARTAQGG